MLRASLRPGPREPNHRVILSENWSQFLNPALGGNRSLGAQASCLPLRYVTIPRSRQDACAPRDYRMLDAWSGLC